MQSCWKGGELMQSFSEMRTVNAERVERKRVNAELAEMRRVNAELVERGKNQNC